MPHQSFIIAIDGPTASGKGTLAKRLAAELGFAALDTGLLYRAVGYLTLQACEAAEDEKAALHAADQLHSLLATDILQHPDLRLESTAQAASIVSGFASVRQCLFDVQRQFALKPPAGKKGVVLDGRDIGTVICPDADVKFFVTASPEVRAERRAREAFGDAWQTNYAEQLEKLNLRDARDQERAVAPLKPAEDAHVFNTTRMPIDAVLAASLVVVRAHPKFIAQATTT
jgi:CMP/dCMP kinase